MKIKGLNRVIPGGRQIESMGDNLLLYTLDDGLYCNGELISPTYLYPYLNYDGGHYLRSSEPPAIYRLDPESNSIRLCVSRSRRIRLGTSDECLLLGRYKNREHTYTLELEGKEIWTKTTSLSQVIQVGPYALFYQGRGQLKGSCQLIELATGAVLWELDHPDAYISQVFPYKDKVIIVWFWELGTKGTSRVLCVEVPSGKVLWENDAAREYKKYGEDKLVHFYVHYWEDGNDDRDLYAELDVHTGEVYTRRYPGYNANVFVTTIYKDYLFYGAEKADAYVGAIDLRTHEMLDEVKVDFTPGDCNHIKSIGVHDGQLYVEIQTELDHSDIHVLDLDEEECSAGKEGIYMGRKIRICWRRGECCYPEQSTGFYVHLCELLKDPSRVEQLVKEGYVVHNYYLDRVDRALDMEFLEALQDHFLERERKGELYTTGDPDPYMLFLYQPGVTSKLLAKSFIEVEAVLGPHTISYEVSRAYMNVIYCDTKFIGPEEKEYLIERYGAPTCTKESRGEQYGPGGYIIIPVEDVDKLVAVERFRALDNTDEIPVYTGEERIYELDLRAPEESVYKYFLGHGIILEYDPENFAPEYLYPSPEEEDTEKQRSKGYLPSWLRSLWRKVSTLLRGEDRG
ncbi:hypothetical protein [Porphyromonas sp.]